MPEISVIGTHSLGSGGAAAAKAGISDRLFQRHGRWSGDSAKDGYVMDYLSSRLSVSQALVLYFFFFLVLPGGPLKLGYSWPGVFLLGASGRTGRFFTQLLFHDLISVSFRFLYEFSCMLHGLFCKLMYYCCIVICCID